MTDGRPTNKAHGEKKERNIGSLRRDGAKSDIAFSFVALQSIWGIFCTRFAYETSSNSTRHKHKIEEEKNQSI